MAPMAKLPDEIRALPHWVGHTNKRPDLAPDRWADAYPYDRVKARTSNYGVLVAPHTESPYLFLDIDYPLSKKDGPERAAELKIPYKEDIEAQMATNGTQWGSEEHLQLIEPTLASIRGTSLNDLLTTTYTEFSPSGTGLRMIIRSADKSKFTKAYKKATAFKGQIDFRDQFITITERGYPGAPSVIAEVPLMRLADAFGFREQAVVVMPDGTTQAPTAKLLPVQAQADEDDTSWSSGSLPKPEVVIEALQSIPIDQSARVRTVWCELTGETYEHYNFWLSIGMALHDYARHTTSPSRLYLAYLKWSEQDVASFTGEQDVHAKWMSFDMVGRPDNVTWRTLLKLANKCVFDYPRPVIDKKGRPTGSPMTNEWANFEYLLDYYNIQLHEDDGFYVSGEKEICDRYFRVHGAQCWFDKYYGPLSPQGLIAATLRLCQDSKWRGLTTTSIHVNTWLAQRREDMDLFKLWLDTPFDALPEEFKYISTGKGRMLASVYDKNSTVDYIFEMMNTQYDSPVERALAKSMLRKTLMQMIKFREDLSLPFTDNGGMLILLGAENTYKSTFFKLLLPKPLEQQRKEVNMKVSGEKSVRDFVRNLGRKTIMQIDEFEGIMDHAKDGSLFKAVISGDSASITDIYQTTESNVSRKAVIVGTSNEMRQVLSDNGTRRMWFVKVNKINTNGMLQINLHKLYNDLRNEFRAEYADGRMPWLLTQQEINVLYKMNESLTAKSDIAMWLDDVWPTSAPMPDDYMAGITSIQTDKSGRLFTTKDVLQMLVFRGMRADIKLPGLERALERHCGKWTGTHGLSTTLVKPRGLLANGRLMQGQMPNGKYKYAKWVMPPLAEAMPDESAGALNLKNEADAT